MKQLLKLIFFYSLISLLGYANIDSKIEAIQEAPVEERFRLMNAFKKEIIQMQEQERIEALTKLKNITKSKHADNAIKELMKHSKLDMNKHRDIERLTNKKAMESEDHSEHETTEEEIENETEDHIENEAEEQVEHETEDQTEEDHDDD